ncbi:MAG: CHAT domain-containing protein, partial [Bacteroidota bacterium]
GLLLQSSQRMRARIKSSGDTNLIQKFESWQEKKDYLAQLNYLSKAEREKRGINISEIKNEVNELEKALSLKSQDFKQVREEKYYSWKDVRQKLKAGEAALEIIRSRYIQKGSTDSVIYIALIIKPETKKQPEMVVLANGNELEGKYLKRYRNAIEYQRSTRIGYEQYWWPIAQQLTGIQKVYLSADGVFHQINLNTLKNPASGKYLLEEMEIHQLSSTKDLVQKRLTSKIPQSESILMGRPKYNLSEDDHLTVVKDNAVAIRGGEAGFYTTREEMAQVQFSDLPGTEAETRQIFTLLKSKKQKAALYLGENALEEVIKRAQSPKILHVATHGFFFENNRTISAQNQSRAHIEAGELDIDMGDLRPFNANVQSIQEIKTNPMLRSCIVLTGVSTYAQSKEKYVAEDGLLSAYEAQNLNLDNTELVVLSACETGKGDLSYGEGVYGLQRGFLKAGAKSIIMSLWSVDDQATQKLMTEFYTQWLSGKTKREAFRLAQSKLRAEYKYPFYWGGFVMVGE